MSDVGRVCWTSAGPLTHNMSFVLLWVLLIKTLTAKYAVCWLKEVACSPNHHFRSISDVALVGMFKDEIQLAFFFFFNPRYVKSHWLASLLTLWPSLKLQRQITKWNVPWPWDKRLFSLGLKITRNIFWCRKQPKSQIWPPSWVFFFFSFRILNRSVTAGVLAKVIWWKWTDPFLILNSNTHV